MLLTKLKEKYILRFFYLGCMFKLIVFDSFHELHLITKFKVYCHYKRPSHNAFNSVSVFLQQHSWQLAACFYCKCY